MRKLEYKVGFNVIFHCCFSWLTSLIVSSLVLKEFRAARLHYVRKESACKQITGTNSCPRNEGWITQALARPFFIWLLYAFRSVQWVYTSHCTAGHWEPHCCHGSTPSARPSCSLCGQLERTHTHTQVHTHTFTHLADAFIQSDLHCIQVTVSTFYQLILSAHTHSHIGANTHTHTHIGANTHSHIGANTHTLK